MFLVFAVLKKWNITNPWAVFAVGTLVSTMAELIGSYLSEAITGHQLWSYEGYFMNFQGRIALKPDLMFGFLILGGMCIVFPKVLEFQEKYRISRTHDVFFWVILILFVVDLLARIWLGSNFVE